MKKFHGRAAYVQSAGVKSDMEVDGFAIAVCAEIGVNLEDFRLEHNYGRQVGLGHLSVDASREELLTRELSARGWTVAES